MIILYVLLAIFVLLLMILIHEAGHYIAGKILKFEIEEFSIGFGPAIFTKKMKSGEIFSLRCIPLGGFCAFKGEDEDEEDDDEEESEEPLKIEDDVENKKLASLNESVVGSFPDKKEGFFNSYPCWKRLIVLVSGALFNFLSGILFSFILLMSVGSGIMEIDNIAIGLKSENSFSNYEYCFVLEDGYELKEGDILLEINDNELAFVNGGLDRLAKKNGKDSFEITVKRGNEKITVLAKNYIDPDADKKDEEKSTDIDPSLNVIGLDGTFVKYSFGSALLNAVPYTFDMAWECLVILGELFTGQLGLDAVGGPVTTISTIATSAQADLRTLLLMFPLIAVNLAVFNLLPVPSLDGARSVFVLIEWIFGKPVPREIEGKIHAIGLMILFGLVIVVDVLHIFLF